MRDAMRAREAGRARLSLLRLALSAVKNQEIERRRPLSDEEVVDVLAREVRGRRDVLPDYERAGRAELVEKIGAEIAMLEEYLPAQLSDEEIAERVRARIGEVGARGPKDLGRVMGPLMQELRGRAEGSRVQAIVRRELGAD